MNLGDKGETEKKETETGHLLDTNTMISFLGA